MLFNFTFPKSLWRFLASTFVILIGCSLCKMESNSFLPLCALKYIEERELPSAPKQKKHPKPRTIIPQMVSDFECKGIRGVGGV